MENAPTWLKIMQNGTIGEAKTKAFLIDRFWILERSVDIDGADFIIQRRILQNTILDNKPPRMGLIQVKYYSSDKTTQYIHPNYIVNDKGELRKEFFLLCHSGSEDNSSIYFLTSEMIKNDFSIGKNKKYSITGKKILSKDKYLVKSKKGVLDTIKSALKSSDYRNNQKFITSKLYKNISEKDILPDFEIPLENRTLNIQEEFTEIKSNVKNAMSELETLYDTFNGLINESDPIELFNKIERNEDNLIDFGRFGTKLNDLICQPDFYDTCKEHKDKIDLLRRHSVLENFLNIRSKLKNKISIYLAESSPFKENTVHKLKITFNKNDFTSLKIVNTLLDDYQIINQIEKINDSSFFYFWKPYSKEIISLNKSKIEEYFSDNVYDIYHNCEEEIYKMKSIE
ncbi:MAG: hypothetical protein ACI8RP_001907 [Urechidicola sp.]|jgi:hypothetical protein